MSQPFEILSLRFARIVEKQRVVADVRPELTPTYPGVDWDHARDGRSTSKHPTSFVAVIGPRRPARLTVNVRFANFPSNARWAVHAVADPDPEGTPAVAVRTLKESRPGCVSREISFTVTDPRLPSDRVGRYQVEWHWFGRRHDAKTGRYDPPQEVGVTRFVVYSIAGAPIHAPWTQSPESEPDRDLPWVPVLDWACSTAAGATSPLEGAAVLTREMYALGSPDRIPEKKRQFVNLNSDQFICDEEHHIFRCAAFLRAMTEPVTAERPARVACNDMATALCVFANVLGADLMRHQIAMNGDRMPVREVKPIGVASTLPFWRHHEIACASHTGTVFDAFLQFPATGIEEGKICWESPVDMPLGHPRCGAKPAGYLQRLLSGNIDKCAVNKLAAPTLDRRSGGTVPPGPITRRYEAFLAQLQGYTPLPAVPRPSVSTPTCLPKMFFKVPAAVFETLDASFRATRSHASAEWSTGSARYWLAVEWAASTPDALELAAWRLTFYHGLDLVAPPSAGFQPVFVTQTGQQGLAVVANLVLEFGVHGHSGETVNMLWGPEMPLPPLGTTPS